MTERTPAQIAALDAGRKKHNDDVRATSEAKRGLYLAAICNGKRRGAAAKAVGVSLDVLRTWRSDPRFAQLEVLAEEEASEPIEDKLYEMALSGHFASMVKWLDNRASARWLEKKAEAAAVQVQVSIDTGPIIERIQNLNDRLAIRSGTPALDAAEETE